MRDNEFTCRHCNFFDIILETYGVGECRRHAPIASKRGGLTERSFPPVCEGCWCGDWVKEQQEEGPKWQLNQQST